MKSDILKHISKNFAKLMEQNPDLISPKDLSSRSRISYSTLAPILRGDRDFGVIKLIALADALHVTPNDLLEGVYKEIEHHEFSASTSSPLYLISFVSSGELTRCNIYDLATRENRNDLFPVSLACTTPASKTVEMMNTAISNLCGQNVDLAKVHVYASVLGYEHIDGRNRLNELGFREYGFFIMEPDWKIAHNSIFPDRNGIVITINDGYAISYSTDHGEHVSKVQGYVPFAAEAGNMWLGSEAIKHAINVKEGVEKRTLLSDRILSVVYSDLNLLATKIFDHPRDTYIQISTIVKELALREKKSFSLIEQGFKNIWKRIRLIDQQIGEELPICLAGDLAYLYEDFIPKARLYKVDYANDEECFNYTNNLLLNLMKKR